MRSFARFMISGLLFCLAPASTWAQETLHCSPCSHSFGSVPMGSSKTYSIHFTNTGDTTLKLLAQPKPAAGFSFSHVPWQIQARTSFDLAVTFTPKAQGLVTDLVNIVSTAENSPLIITVQGTGDDTTSPQLTISPATLMFGKVTVGSSARLNATLKAKNGAITISSGQSTSSEFDIILGITLPVTVAAGGSLPITIQFTPNASGQAWGKAGFISTALNTPTVAKVTGMGVAQGSHEVDLSWNPGDGNAIGFNVYRGTSQAGPFALINTALDSSNGYEDSTVAAGETYYYAATEVSAQGEESAYSNVVTAVVPSP